MMTAASIPASTAAGYADYLESRTAAPARGDYYLGTEGAPAEAPGRWLTSGDGLARVGVKSGERVRPDDLRALMAGHAAGGRAESPHWLRPPGADGTRAGGVDVTFSAPKSVSVVWALGDDDLRAGIEAAHGESVRASIDYLRDRVPTTVGWDAGRGAPVPALAGDLHAAEFLHTTARGVDGELPDPQLHSHVVITSVERRDGSTAAVRSRPVFQAARELGAHYRAGLAARLRELS